MQILDLTCKNCGCEYSVDSMLGYGLMFGKSEEDMKPRYKETA